MVPLKEIVYICLVMFVDAFTPPYGNWRSQFLHRSNVVVMATSSNQMESDFGSAMPEKPQISPDDFMRMSAENFVLSMRGSLADGLQEPPELQVLEGALENGAGANELALRIYELMIERGMRYDVAPETGTLTETQFDVPNNLDVAEVRQEFLHLYTYGMNLIRNGLITVEDTKKIVAERLIPRTGLTPEAFDEWLGF